MKVRTYVIILTSVVVVFVILALPKMRASNKQFLSGLKLDIVTDKEDYLTGEPVHLKFKILNQSETPTSLYRGSTVWDGYIDVFVAYQGEDYKRYRGPQWGLRDVFYKEPLILNPGEVFESGATMLCNPFLATSHLNRTAATRALQRENLVEGNYLLSRAGYYFIKAVLRDPKSDNSIESAPVRIIAREPEGVDLEVWNKIKGSREYAYFIQTGSLGSPAENRTKEVVDDLQRIVNSHPTSRYVDGIRKSLTEHRSVGHQPEKE